MNLTSFDKTQKFSIDSRTIKPGEVFIALQGPNFDGHDFIANVAAKGAKAAIVERKILCDIPLVEVVDTYQALVELAKIRRSQVDIHLVALTGSCGKTTTKTMLANILQLCGKTLATYGNLNNDIGVPLTLLNLTCDEQFAVIEMGASHIGDIARLTNIARPTVALITNAAPVHLERIGDLDRVAQTKGEIFQGLAKEGTAVLNCDDKYFNFWVKLVADKKIISFSLQNKADITAKNIFLDAEGRGNFLLCTPSGKVAIELQFLGEHNIKNALAAAACAFTLNIPLDNIQQGLLTTQPVSKRMVKKYSPQKAIIIDDSYNANPCSMQEALKVLMSHTGEKIFVVGDMAELGAREQQYHQDLGKLARSMGVHRLYAIGNLTLHTVQAFGNNAQHFADKKELLAVLQKKLHPDMVILIKGSKINNLWEVVDGLMQGT